MVTFVYKGVRRWKVKNTFTVILIVSSIYIIGKDIDIFFLDKHSTVISKSATKKDKYSQDEKVAGSYINRFNDRKASLDGDIFQWKPNCRKLIEADDVEIRRTENYCKNNQRIHPFPDAQYMNFTIDCKKFMSDRGYTLKVSAEEETMPIAYGLTIHQKVEQVERLLKLIYRPNNLYCIHVDKNADISILNGVRSIASCFPNVFVASKLESIVYAGFSRLQADFNCMGDALKSSIKWKYYINLSGEMFPLKTNLEIVKILKIYNGSNDIEGIAGMRAMGQKYKWTNKHITENIHGKQVIVRTNETKPPPPHKIELVKGSGYGVFTREFLDYALHDSVAQEFLNWTKDINTPDEVFWSTLHHTKYNPIFKAPGGYAEFGINDSVLVSLTLREDDTASTGDANENKWMAVYASWPPRDPCQGKTIHQICIPKIRDLPMIVSRKQLYFNKLKPFTYYNDYLVLECLEEWMRNKTMAPIPLDIFEYTNLPFVKSRSDSYATKQ